MQENIKKYVNDLEGIFKIGFGYIPISVIRNTNISIQAKTIYCYLMCFLKDNNTVSVDEDLIIYDLHISKYILDKYLNELLDNGFIVKNGTEDNLNNYIVALDKEPEVKYIKDLNTNVEETNGGKLKPEDLPPVE